jgi:hypothetical protein
MTFLIATIGRWHATKSFLDGVLIFFCPLVALIAIRLAGRLERAIVAGLREAIDRGMEIEVELGLRNALLTVSREASEDRTPSGHTITTVVDSLEWYSIRAWCFVWALLTVHLLYTLS